MVLHRKLIIILVFSTFSQYFGVQKYFKAHCVHFESQVVGLIALEGRAK